MKQWLSTNMWVVATGDPFQGTSSFLSSTTGKFVGIGAVVFGLILVVTGLIYSFAGAELKAKIKKKWVDILVGAVCVFGGTALIGWLVQFVTQNFG